MADELVTDLVKLAELHNSGVLSDEEFAAAKERLLSHQDGGARRDVASTTSTPARPLLESPSGAEAGPEAEPAQVSFSRPASAVASPDLPGSQSRDTGASPPPDAPRESTDTGGTGRKALRVVAALVLALLLAGGAVVANSVMSGRREAALIEQARQQREQEQEVLEFLAEDLTFRCEWNDRTRLDTAPGYFDASTESGKVQAIMRGAMLDEEPWSDAELAAARPGTALFEVVAVICGRDRQLAADIIDWERQRRELLSVSGDRATEEYGQDVEREERADVRPAEDVSSDEQQAARAMCRAMNAEGTGDYTYSQFESSLRGWLALGRNERQIYQALVEECGDSLADVAPAYEPGSLG